MKSIALVSYALVTACALLISQPASAASILQDQTNGVGIFSPGQPVMGQSFTAENSSILSVGIGLEIVNPQLSRVDVLMSLYEGLGTSGTLLGQVSVLPPAVSGAFVDFDFSSVSLTPGNLYSLVLSTSNPYWGLQTNQHSLPGGTPLPGAIDYPGGDLLIDDVASPLFDTRFRVLIPEPGSLSLLLAGVTSIVFLR